jgi:HipA-like kinase
VIAPTFAPPRTVTATRYVTPLREGGSLPALVEADDDGLYVLKFRGAGQGPKALVAELIGGEVARALGLRVPEIVFIELDPELARAEPDPEIQDLIRASGGLNIGLDYLPGSLPFVPDAARREAPDASFAADVVWLDAYLTNVDRTPRNPNLLRWHGNIWLIDHGAALYLQHAGLDPLLHARRPFAQIAEHVLLPFAEPIERADARLAPRLTDARIAEIVGTVPEDWVEGTGREAYAEYLTLRLQAPRLFGQEADAART